MISELENSVVDNDNFVRGIMLLTLNLHIYISDNTKLQKLWQKFSQKKRTKHARQKPTHSCTEGMSVT